jgi:pimeloyl-ACP methyl ester carboxylesterase
MPDSEKTIIEYETPGLKTHGILKKGKEDLRSLKPLIVLIHGGGCNASYFDNDFHSWVKCTMEERDWLNLSVPKAFNETGFDVLSINRVGYGGDPIPQTASPVLDSIPLYSALIKKAYEEHSNGKNGIVLVGHSLGAATSLSIAAFEGQKLPLLGVSALGIIPTKDHPAGLVDMLKADPENPRFTVEASPEAIEAFMGPPSVIDQSTLVHPSMPQIFEPGKQESFLLVQNTHISRS